MQRGGVTGRVYGEGLLSIVGDRGWDDSGLNLREATIHDSHIEHGRR